MFGKKQTEEKSLASVKDKPLATSNGKGIELTQSASEGGVTPEDFVVPRAVILNDAKPGIAVGTIINNITSESLPDTIIPLFVFKNYAEFDSKLNLIWSTTDRNDPKVVEGLKWRKDNRGDTIKPTAVEFLNLVAIFGDRYDFPLIFSFKRTSIGLGRKYNTQFSFTCGVGKPPGAKNQQFIRKFRYKISTKQIVDGKYVYYHPEIRTIENKQERELNPGLQQQLAQIADTYQAIIRRMPAENQVAKEERASEFTGEGVFGT